MTIQFNDDIIAARLTAISDAVDAGGAGAKIIIYTGIRPAVAGQPTTEQTLATLTMSYPAFNVPSGDSITAYFINPVIASGTGTAGWFRVTTSTGVFVMDGTVGVSVADMVMPTAEIVAGITVSVSSMVLTDGN